MSLLPTKYTLSAWSGATFRKTITWLGNGGVPVNLTGYTGTMTIAASPGATPFYTLSTTGPGITLGGSQGTIQLYIPASSTSTLQSGVYQLSVVDATGSGDTFALLWGQFAVRSVS